MSTKCISAMKIVLIAILTTLLSISYGAAYNKSWDQGHKCCHPNEGGSTWGRYDYDGNHRGKYTTKECCQLLCKICPVYANTGQLQKTFTDLTVPGVGPALNITRTYNSQEWATSLLGQGWIFNFGKRLIITRNKAGEKVVGVRLETGEKNFYKEHADGTLERLTEYGATYDLIKNSDNTYTIANRDGSRYELLEDGKIAKIIDQNHNELVFSYNSVGCLSRITNASGNYIDFQLGPNGKIASVSDNLGRTVAYTYDESGNLISVTDPIGNTRQYVYNSENLLAQIIDANGNVVESATYDNNQPPRVSTFIEKGETYTIAYFDGRTEKSDSHGNKWTYYFTDLGIIDKVVDPLGNVKQQQLNKVTSTSVDWEEDLNGNRTIYTYDADGNIASKTDPLGNIWTYIYVAGADWLETETNPLGVVTKYEYDANGNVIRMIQDFGGPLQNVTSYTYDSEGKQTSVTDPMGNTASYEYDANGNLIKVTDALGNKTTYTYDSRGNRFTETDALGNTTTHTYDLLDRLVSVTDALGNTITYTYDANGNKISETDANGNIRTFTYDAWNRLTQEADPLGNTSSYTYDSRDNRTSMTDANGNTTTYTYDILNRLIRETNPLGGQTSYTYDAEGNMLSITDANGNTTTFTYDANNRKISETNALGEITTYTYDANGNLITQTLPNGNTITNTYDSLSSLINVADALGQIRSYIYNLAGLLLTEIDALGNTISYSYDANNRVVQQTDPLGNNETYSYDAVGNLLVITDREGNTTNYSYDALKRRTSQTDQQENTITFSYNKVGSLLSITDANGNVTNYSYDNANRLIEKAYADGTTRIFGYDAAGRLITRTDQKGQITNYLYDNLNRRIKVDYPDSNDNNYSYDGVGNLLIANNESAMVSFTYDNAYRLTQSVQSGKTVTYSYDITNSTKTITYPGGKVVKEVRNPRELFLRIENASGQAIVQYTYDSAYRLQTKSYINGITANLTNNANGWITNLTYNDGGSQIIGLLYGFDNEANKLYANKLNDPSNSEQYIYNAKYQLIDYKIGQMVDDQIPNPQVRNIYGFDPLGNWNSQTRDGVVEGRVHNNLNQIVSINGVSFVHDPNGNLEDDGERIYAYDAEDRLIRIARKSDGSILFECQYDALGRRIAKTSYVPVTEELHFVYDGKSFLVLAELDPGGTLEKTYVWGPDLGGTKERVGGVGGLVAMDDIGLQQSSLYLYDGNGNVIMLVDATSGQVTAEYEYSAFGELVSAVGSRAELNPFRFSTKYYDDEVRLLYYGYRYYSPTLGRWITKDPLTKLSFGGAPVDLTYSEHGLNPYLFVDNSPVSDVDAYGLQKWRKCKPPEIWKTNPNGVIPPADGCSYPSWLGWALPVGGNKDNPTGRCSFLSACNFHDCCYSNCSKTQQQCDSGFHALMKGACNGCAQGLIGKSKKKFVKNCNKWAGRYHWAVSSFGGSAYKNRQQKNCHCSCLN